MILQESSALNCLCSCILQKNKTVKLQASANNSKTDNASPLYDRQTADDFSALHAKRISWTHRNRAPMRSSSCQIWFLDLSWCPEIDIGNQRNAKALSNMSQLTAMQAIGMPQFATGPQKCVLQAKKFKVLTFYHLSRELTMPTHLMRYSLNWGLLRFSTSFLPNDAIFVWLFKSYCYFVRIFLPDNKNYINVHNEYTSFDKQLIWILKSR